MRFLAVSIELLFDLGPYVLCAAAGAYAEAKWGSAAKLVLASAKAKLEADAAALKTEL